VRNSYKARHNAGKQFKYYIYSFNQTMQGRRNISKRSSLRRYSSASILKPIYKSGVKNLKTQDKYISIVNIDRGKGYALTSLIIGIIDIAAVVIIL
jgi:hypothetical protein